MKKENEKGMGKTYVAMILDKSGSMLAIRKPSLDSFNDQIKALKEESAKNSMEMVLSIVLFDQEIIVMERGAEIALVEEIKETEYLPGGMTALLDAIGQTITKFEKAYELGENDAVLFVIVTDGQENASSEYKGGEGRKLIKEKIKSLTDTGHWTFSFIGTEEALDQAEDFGISSVLRFNATPQGMGELADTQTTAYSAYLNRRRGGETSVENLYASIPQGKEEGNDL